MRKLKAALICVASLSFLLAVSAYIGLSTIALESAFFLCLSLLYAMRLNKLAKAIKKAIPKSVI